MNDTPRRYAIVEAQQLSLEAFSTAAELHPQIVLRLVTLGLIEARTDERDQIVFLRSQVAVVAKIQRLRHGLGLNYAGVGAVLELLDRVAELEAQVRAHRAT